MKLRVVCVVALLSLVLSLNPLIVAQTSTQTVSALPRLVRFGGPVKDLSGSPMAGVVGITFALYSEKTGGSPLWLETQNVTADSTGHYTVLLGSTKPDGLPAELFTSEQARWVGVQVSGQAEQPRVLLVSAPYALKAGDAETIGGLPPSAFVLAAPPTISSATASGPPAAESVSPATTSDVTTTGGTADAIPLFFTATSIQNSLLTQTGTTAVNVGGKLNLPATGVATAAAGKNSQGLNLVASSFNKTSSTAVNQTFQWQAEPAANDTTAPSGTLNLLYGLGAAAPSETGLKLSSKGIFSFATGQTFPGTGDGTVTSVASGTGLTGGPITKTGTLSVDATKVPLLASANTFTANQTVNGNLKATSANISNTAAIISAAGTPLYVQANSSGATAIYGFAAATAAEGTGVYGVTNSPIGVGTFGQNGVLSGTGSLYAGVFGAGIWGDGGADSNYGVIGTTDDHAAGLFHNNSPSYYTLYAFNDATGGIGYPFSAVNADGNGCSIDPLGNFSCTGTKSAVVPIDGGKHRVALAAIESPKNWFEDFGSDQLFGGVATVQLEPKFTQTVNTGVEYHVFLTPNGDCRGLYVAQKTTTTFEVRELGGGNSNVKFDYRITALRKNYEKIRLADHTREFPLRSDGRAIAPKQ